MEGGRGWRKKNEDEDEDEDGERVFVISGDEPDGYNVVFFWIFVYKKINEMMMKNRMGRREER